MFVSHLTLRDFRSYALAELSLEAGTSVLVGHNGVGKTNVVEAIGYLSTQASHRVANDAPLVRFGAERAIVGARVERGKQATAVELEVIPGRANRARINRSNPTRAREALGIVRSVLFAPEDLELVKGDPGARRRFLDDLVVQLRPDQGAVRADYERVLKQRNALLKSIRGGGRMSSSHEATLDVWDAHLAAAGARVLRNRVHVLGLVAPHLAESYASLTDGSKAATALYLSTVTGDAERVAGPGEPVADPRLVGATLPEYEARLLAALQGARRREAERGVTLVGPHRDDVMLGLGPAPAKGFASHGETWSLALALRLASYSVLTDDDPAPTARPVLMLDDVFAELDARRRAKLVATVTQAEQIIVTAAVREDVPAELDARLIRVGPGWVGSEPEPAGEPAGEPNDEAPRAPEHPASLEEPEAGGEAAPATQAHAVGQVSDVIPDDDAAAGAIQEPGPTATSGAGAIASLLGGERE